MRSLLILILLDPIISPSTLVILPCTLLSLSLPLSFNSPSDFMSVLRLPKCATVASACRKGRRMSGYVVWCTPTRRRLPFVVVQKGSSYGVYETGSGPPMMCSSLISMCNTSFLCPLSIPPSLSFCRRGST